MVLVGIHNTCQSTSSQSSQKMTDNIACMFYINQEGGACSHSLCTETIKLWNWCINHKVTITTSCLPGCQNTKADAVSRYFSQDHEWEPNDSIIQHIFQMWGFCVDLFATAWNNKCPQICSWVGLGPRSLGERLSHQMGCSSPVCIPTDTTKIQNNTQDTDRQAKVWHGPGRPGTHTWGTWQCVCHTVSLCNGILSRKMKVKSSIRAWRNFTRMWLLHDELTCSEQVKQVLVNSRKSTTRTTYVQKWKRFSLCCQNKHVSALKAPLPLGLEYILEPKNSGLSTGLARVRLPAITAFHHKVDGISVFAHLMTKRFLKRYIKCMPRNRRTHET